MHLALDDKMAGQEVVAGKVRERASEVCCMEKDSGNSEISHCAMESIVFSALIPGRGTVPK